MPKNKNKRYAPGVRVIHAKDGAERKLVKIGVIAQALGILPSTVNFYTREGLLPEDARSRGGYRLYHYDRTTERIKRIDYLQRQKRMSIAEIKKVL
jgi:DNA-binding transcriptional MerR regulator